MKQVENSMYGKAGKKSIYYTLVYYGLNDLVSSSFSYGDNRPLRLCSTFNLVFNFRFLFFKKQVKCMPA